MIHATLESEKRNTTPKSLTTLQNNKKKQSADMQQYSNRKDYVVKSTAPF